MNIEKRRLEHRKYNRKESFFFLKKKRERKIVELLLKFSYGDFLHTLLIAVVKYWFSQHFLLDTSLQKQLLVIKKNFVSICKPGENLLADDWNVSRLWFTKTFIKTTQSNAKKRCMH